MIENDNRTESDIPRCPECGSSLDIQSDAEIGTTVFRQAPCTMPYLEHGVRPATVAFCTGCEFAVELVMS